MIKSLSEKHGIICADFTDIAKRCLTRQNDITAFRNKASSPFFVGFFCHIANVFNINISVANIRCTQHLEWRGFVYDRSRPIDAVNMSLAKTDDWQPLPSDGVSAHHSRPQNSCHIGGDGLFQIAGLGVEGF